MPSVISVVQYREFEPGARAGLAKRSPTPPSFTTKFTIRFSGTSPETPAGLIPDESGPANDGQALRMPVAPLDLEPPNLQIHK